MRFDEKQKIIGYVLVVVLILGLIYLIYWTVILGGSIRDFPGIEDLRGELLMPHLNASFVINKPWAYNS